MREELQFMWEREEVKRGHILCRCDPRANTFAIRRFNYDNIVYAVCCRCGEEISLSEIFNSIQG